MTEKKELFKAPKTVSAALLTGCKNISRAKKLSEHSLLALDWELELYSGMPVPDNINYVGMRAHHLAAVEYVDQNNVMNCQIINVIENPFSYIVMLINLDSKENAHIKIRWEVDKNKWDTVCKTNSVKLLFDKDNLLLLS